MVLDPRYRIISDDDQTRYASLKANSESFSQSAEETDVSVDLTNDAPMPGQTPPAKHCKRFMSHLREQHTSTRPPRLYEAFRY